MSDRKSASRATGAWAECQARSTTGLASLDAVELALVRIPIQRVHLDAQAFLHGNCDVFALALNAKYGYPVEIATSPGWNDPETGPLGALCHAYCRDGRDYIDVRGRTSDRTAFFLPFAHPVDAGFPQPSIKEIRKGSIRILGGAFRLWLADAKDLIRARPDWYGPLPG